MKQNDQDRIEKDAQKIKQMETLVDVARINNQNQQNQNLVRSVQDGTLKDRMEGKAAPSNGGGEMGTSIHLGDNNYLPPESSEQQPGQPPSPSAKPKSLLRKMIPIAAAAVLGGAAVGTPLALGWLDSILTKNDPNSAGIDTDTKYGLDFAEPKTKVKN